MAARHDAVFDIPLLADRLALATARLRAPPIGHAGPIGYCGGSTGTAAGPGTVGAIVSRSGRPDLVAPDVLGRVRTPVLLIVGGREHPDLLAANRAACALLAGEAEVRVMDGAGHLFAEPGTLEEAARLAVAWFAPRIGARRGEGRGNAVP